MRVGRARERGACEHATPRAEVHYVEYVTEISPCSGLGVALYVNICQELRLSSPSPEGKAESLGKII